MVPQLWLVGDSLSQVSYVRHGPTDDEPNWRQVGPFAFTSKVAAEAAIQDPLFLPTATDPKLLEVDSSSFVRAIFNGFPPKFTDVFFLDGVLIPLTSRGAAWVDEAQDVPIWSPLFDEGGDGVGLEWLDRVLEMVAARLQMQMETIQAIGTLNAADEDEAAAQIDQAGPLLKQNVQITITPEKKPRTKVVNGRRVLPPTSQFWLHTDGLYKLGLQELEIRNVPARWITAAGEELMVWAAYSLENDLVDGARLESPGPMPATLILRASPDPQWEGHPTGCLRLVIESVTFETVVAEEEENAPRTLH